MTLVSCQGGIAAITIDSATLCIVHRSRLKGVMRKDMKRRCILWKCGRAIDLQSPCRFRLTHPEGFTEVWLQYSLSWFWLSILIATARFSRFADLCRYAVACCFCFPACGFHGDLVWISSRRDPRGWLRGL